MGPIEIVLLIILNLAFWSAPTIGTTNRQRLREGQVVQGNSDPRTQSIVVQGRHFFDEELMLPPDSEGYLVRCLKLDGKILVKIMGEQK